MIFHNKWIAGFILFLPNATKIRSIKDWFSFDRPRFGIPLCDKKEPNNKECVSIIRIGSLHCAFMHYHESKAYSDYIIDDI